MKKGILSLAALLVVSLCIVNCGRSKGGGGGSISGTVSGVVQTGVTMTLSGASSGTATTDASGNYSFTGLSKGSYVVTPSLLGYAFSPTGAPVNVRHSNVPNINFVAGIGNPMSGGDNRWADSSVTFTGTYTYNTGTHALVLNGGTASPNMVCGGVLPGTHQDWTVTTLDADTLILNSDTIMTYNCVGTCTGIVGTWTTSPKSYPWEKDTVTINSDLSFHGAISGLNCAMSNSSYDCNTSHSYFDAWVDDPLKLITSVTVSGDSTNIGAGDIDLNHSSSSWYLSSAQQLIAPPKPIETFTMKILEGTTTYTLTANQKFYGENECPICVSPLTGEQLSGDTVNMSWEAVPANADFVEYEPYLEGPAYRYTDIYDRTTTSATFGGLNKTSWYDMDIYTYYTSWDYTERYCGDVRTK
jgi:hypothetical protein